MYTLINVQLNNMGKAYVFKCYDDVAIDDLVIVDTVNGFLVGKVLGISETIPTGKVLNEVVGVIDPTPFIERKKKAERLNELKKTMDKKVKTLQSLTMYETLAEKDPELKTMLDEYRSLL